MRIVLLVVSHRWQFSRSPLLFSENRCRVALTWSPLLFSVSWCCVSLSSNLMHDVNIPSVGCVCVFVYVDCCCFMSLMPFYVLFLIIYWFFCLIYHFYYGFSLILRPSLWQLCFNVFRCVFLFQIFLIWWMNIHPGFHEMKTTKYGQFYDHQIEIILNFGIFDLEWLSHFDRMNAF